MFTKVDSFYSFPLTGIIPLEFKLLKSSSLGYLKGSPPPTESGVSLADPGCTGTHASLKWEVARSCCPRECSSGSGLESGLSLPPAPLQFIPGSTKGNLEKGEGETGGHCLGGVGGWVRGGGEKRILRCHLQPGRARAMPQSAFPGAGTVLSQESLDVET